MYTAKSLLVLILVFSTTSTVAANDDNHVDWTPPWTAPQSVENPPANEPRAETAEDTIDAASLASTANDGCPRPTLITRASSAESEELELTTCLGTPNRAVLDRLSILARPMNTEVPPIEARQDGEELAPGIRRLDVELLSRLHAIANRWPGEAIVIVSGYRPSPGSQSRHAHAQALDIQVTGAARWDVASFARELPNTGVGYYPNSVFTHIDVREGSVAWMDRSSPGQPSDYAPWPDGPIENTAPARPTTDGVLNDNKSEEEPPSEPPLTREEVRRAVEEAIGVAVEEIPRTELTL